VDLSATVVVSLITVVAAGAMLWWHWSAWRHAQTDDLDDLERDFRERQFRRRMQASGLLGVLGLALLVGAVLMRIPLSPGFLTLYWCGVMALVVWMALLAAVDVWATKYHYGRARAAWAAERSRLEADARRLRELHRGSESNGHPPTSEAADGHD